MITKRAPADYAEALGHTWDQLRIRHVLVAGE